MENNNTTTSVGGLGFVGTLQIVFIVLKLIKKIDWSWFWVLSPTWISAALTLLIIIVIITITIVKIRK